MKLSKEKYDTLMLDLLINLTVEQEAFRNLIGTAYIKRTDEAVEDINEALIELRKNARINLLAQIKSRYEFGDSDDLINSIIKD